MKIKIGMKYVTMFENNNMYNICGKVSNNAISRVQI